MNEDRGGKRTKVAKLEDCHQRGKKEGAGQHRPDAT